MVLFGGVGLFLAYFAWTAIVGPVGVPLTSPTPNAGQAATQFGAVGFYLHVDKVEEPFANEALVWLTFRNTSNQQQRADNADFQLQARNGHWVRYSVFEGCSNGIRTDLYPERMPRTTPLRDPDGAAADAVFSTDICFTDPGPKPWTLIWEPDVAFGPLSEPIRIPLR